MAILEMGRNLQTNTSALHTQDWCDT